MLTFGSLFAGIGGLDLGLERAGMVCKWQVEIDPFCQSILTKHWPEVPKYGDVRELSASDLSPVDVICGGFPCQPVSMAGRRQGIDDPRWLWPHFARLVGEMGPRYVIVENVPGLLSKGGVEVLADLAEMGFDAEWGVVSAAEVGAPHIRERFWLVASQTPRNGRGRMAVANASRRGDDRQGSPRGRLDRIRATADPATIDSGRDDIADRCLRLSEWWTVEPDVGRVANGVPRRVDRLRALGNAVVPQWAEFIGSLVIDMEKSA